MIDSRAQPPAMRLPRVPRSLLLCAVLGAAAAPCWAAVTPSQVLVLYNADWKGDAPFTDPGQDSREIAEHYARMRTDPATGERPHVLGLRCLHGKAHLSKDDLEEDSRDNGSGVVLRQGGRVIAPAGGLRDSRQVEFNLPQGAGNWHTNTLRVVVRPEAGAEVVAVDGGRSATQAAVVRLQGAPTLRLDARKLAAGPVTVRATCEDGEGSVREWQEKYVDFVDVACSRTGLDGVRDDRNYLEDVDGPVKAFLEDPRNARPDGTLLKDHVLFFVVCWGLPRTAAATYGIARGITDHARDHGALVDFGQRLQVMYYDLEGVQGFTPRLHRFDSDGPFAALYFRAPQAWGLQSRGVNPHLHPLSYRPDKGALDALPEPVPFTAERRKGFPGRHLYFSMRLDGEDPLQARALVDRAVHFSRYGAARLGEAPTGATALGRLLAAAGFRFSQDTQVSNRLQFLLLPADGGNAVALPAFLPGGITGTVISHNGLSRGDAPLYRHLAQGVTVTAGAARVYDGSPHIHSHSWWDDELLYPFLLRGRTIGECLLLCQSHLEWVTAFLGDPLCRFPPRPEPPPLLPEIDWGRDVRAWREKDEQGTDRAWLGVVLPTSAEAPLAARLTLVPLDGAKEAGAMRSTFDGRPRLPLGRDMPRGRYRIELEDPFGDRREAVGTLPPPR